MENIIISGLWAKNLRFDEKTTVLKFLSNPSRGSDCSHSTKFTKFNTRISISIYYNKKFVTVVYSRDKVYSQKNFAQSTVYGFG